MKTCIIPLTRKRQQHKRLTDLFTLGIAMGALAFAGLMTSADAATTYIKANNNTALNTTGSYTVAGVPASGDTIQFDSTDTLGTAPPLGGNLSVNAVNQAAGAVASITVGNTAGATLTIGAGGITKSTSTNALGFACNLALGANQTWTVTSPGGTGLLLNAPSFSDNGYTLLITNATGSIGLADFRPSGAVTYGPNVSIKCGQVNINSATADVTLGGANGFTNVIIAAGTIEGSSFPADKNAATTSNFGNASNGTITFGANSTSACTLIYNGSTASTPKTFTMDARSTYLATFKVTTVGQTLTVTNLLYTQGASQTVNRNWNIGGAGNLTIIGPITNANATFTMGINKNDAGTLTLGGTNTYTGTTVVNGGTFALTGSASISNTPSIVLTAGTTFDVSGLSSAFGLQSGQTISNNATASVTLNGNINSGGGGFFGSFKSGLAPFTIQNGTLTLSASTVFNLTSLSSRLSVGTILPIVAKGTGGSVAGTAPNTTSGSLTVGGLTGHLAINSGELDFVVDSSTPPGIEPLHWAGSGSGTWDAANTGNTIWKDSTTPTALSTYFVNGDTVQLDEKYISANQAVALNTTVSPAGMVVSNSTYSYTISGSGVIGGSGNLTKLGAGTLTLATANSYTGGTVISNGTVIMGNATALGGNGSPVNVNGGAVLDVNGSTLTSANTYALTLNGSGPSGGGALIDGIATAATFYGSIALASDSTIKQNGATLTLGDSSHAVPITGNYVLTVGGNSGFIVDIFGNVQVASIVKVDPGQLKLESADSFAGSLTVKNGSVVAKNAASFGSGTIYMLDTTGGTNVSMGLGVNGNFTNSLIVQAGSTGTASINNLGGPYSPVWAGSITLNNNFTLQSQGTAPLGFVSVSGNISGTGALTIGNQYAADTVKLSGTNTYNGATYVTLGTLALTGSASISNSPIISVTGGATFDVTGLTSTFTLASGQVLANSGGTGSLNGNINTGSGTVTATYDGVNPVFANAGSLNLALSAGTVFNVNTASVLPLGTYNLIASGVSGTVPAVTLLRGGGYLQINGGNGLDLVITNTTMGPTQPLHWAGTGTGLWQIATPTNVWKDSSGSPVYTGYADSDQVQFDQLYISADQIVTNNSALNPGSVLVSNPTYNYTITGSGTIGGSANLTKTGNANLVLQCGLNTTGTLTNNGGTIQLASPSASVRQVGGLAGAGGTLDVTNNRLYVSLSGQTNTYSGNVTGNFPSSLGIISAFGLWATNSGTLGLNGAINLSADFSSLSSSSSSSSLGAWNAAELDLGGTTVLTNVTIRNNNTGIVRITGGNHSVTFTGGNTNKEAAYGILLQDSSTCIIDGGTVSVPAVQIGYGGAPSAAGSSLTINGGALTVGINDSDPTNGLWIGDNVTAVTLSSVNLNGGVLTVNAILDGDGETSSGTNVINFNGGKLACASTNVFPSDNGWNGANPLQLLVGNGGAVIDTAGYDNTIILPLQNNGSGGLTKLGAGALALTTNSTYAGATVVSNGTLLVNGSIASPVTVNGGTLGGTGTVSNNVTVNAGGTLSPGTSVNTLTVTGNLSLLGNTLIELNKSLSPSNDMVNVSGSLNYGGTLTVTNLGPALVAGDSFRVFKSGGSGSFSVVGDAGSGLGFSFTDGVISVVTAGPSGPGYITNSVSGSTLTLNWPSGQGWLLQSNSIDLSNSNAWYTVTGATPPYPITINSAKTNVFYRLKY